MFFAAYPGSNGWKAGSGAIYDLESYDLRPETWTSADAAGLPIFPGLVRHDEILAGEITHTIRFTMPQTQRAYVCRRVTTLRARPLASTRPWACASA